MRFVVDECVDQQIVEALRFEGHFVVYIKEVARRSLDEEVINRANDENAILVTTDKDFGELVFRQGKVSRGIILIRLHGLDIDEKMKITVSAIKKHVNDLETHFSVISPTTIRIRNLPTDMK